MADFEMFVDGTFGRAEVVVFGGGAVVVVVGGTVVVAFGGTVVVVVVTVEVEAPLCEFEAA